MPASWPRFFPWKGATRSPRADWVIVHPSAAKELQEFDLTDAARLVDLPGEIVGGHPDRHVRRVQLGSRVAYLKREHRIRWRDRLRHACEGFGLVSKSTREALILRKLEALGFQVGPRWLAYGEDGRGHAFLLVEEIERAEELHCVLECFAGGYREPPPQPPLSKGGIREAAHKTRPKPTPDGKIDIGKGSDQLAHLLAELHAHGIVIPDLYAKHIFVERESGQIRLIDWQRAKQKPSVTVCDRIVGLAALNATIADRLITPLQRARFLSRYLAECKTRGKMFGFRQFARGILQESTRLLKRRSIREQREPNPRGEPQRLVWLDGEEVCAIPAVVEWLTPQLDMLHQPSANHDEIELTWNEKRVRLFRRRFRWPWSRCWAKLRGKNWRSPHLRQARLLFRLQRLGIVAPRLLAFGQRLRAVGGTSFLLIDGETGLDPNTVSQIDEADRRLFQYLCADREGES